MAIRSLLVSTKRSLRSPVDEAAGRPDSGRVRKPALMFDRNPRIDFHPALPYSRSMTNQNFEDRWQAVLTRDPRFNGAFVYGVRSTGVYCRPTCPSRRPRKEQV